MRRSVLLLVCCSLIACSSRSAVAPPPPSSGSKPSLSPSSSGHPSTDRVAAAPDRGKVGYLGCSLTWQTVDGYHLDGGTRMWPAYEGMGSGEIPVWAQELSGAPPLHWAVFDHALALDPVHAFWIQACFMTSQISPDNVAQAESVIAHIRHVVPGATIYFSPMNDWDPPGICGKASSAAVANARQVTDAVVADGVALRGPTMPALPQGQTEDACHPDLTGEALLGGALYRWLGRS